MQDYDLTLGNFVDVKGYDDLECMGIYHNSTSLDNAQI